MDGLTSFTSVAPRAVSSDVNRFSLSLSLTLYIYIYKCLKLFSGLCSPCFWIGTCIHTLHIWIYQDKTSWEGERNMIRSICVLYIYTYRRTLVTSCITDAFVQRLFMMHYIERSASSRSGNPCCHYVPLVPHCKDLFFIATFAITIWSNRQWVHLTVPNCSWVDNKCRQSLQSELWIPGIKMMLHDIEPKIRYSFGEHLTFMGRLATFQAPSVDHTYDIRYGHHTNSLASHLIS